MVVGVEPEDGIARLRVGAVGRIEPDGRRFALNRDLKRHRTSSLIVVM